MKFKGVFEPIEKVEEVRKRYTIIYKPKVALKIYGIIFLISL